MMMDNHNHFRYLVALLGGIAILLNTTMVQAASPPCGTTLTKNTRLDSDMDCAATALLLTGKKSRKVTLNCDGYSVSAVTGTAIIASRVTGVTIRNCNIQSSGYFSHGILLTDGTTKTVVKDNTITTFGDRSRGISLRDSSNNKIIGNTIHAYGSNAANAVLIRSGSNKNLLQRNTLQSEFSYPLNIESSSNNKIYDNSLLLPNGYLVLRSFALQSGGLGVDASGNIYAVDGDWGSASGIGRATAFFQVDPVTGLAYSVMPLLTGGDDVGFGFEALDVLPDGRILALSLSGPPSSLYEIDPISGKVSTIALTLPALDGELNGLEATGVSSLLATTDAGELVSIDLVTGIVTEIGEQGTGWTDLAMHPTNGKVYAVSRREHEASNSAHLYEIDSATGQIVTEIGDTGEMGLSSIDFALDETLYGTSDGVLIEINPANASVEPVNSDGFGPDPLESMPRKNKLQGNLLQSFDGSLQFKPTIVLPTASEIAISSALVEISPNKVRVDSTALPFLDEPARIMLGNLTEDYRNLLVDPEDDGSFNPCESPQCKFVSYLDGTLIFDVNGFTTYSSEENDDPTLEFVVTTVLAEINALLKRADVSGRHKKKLKQAKKDLASALKLLKKGNLKKTFPLVAKTATSLIKVDGTETLIEHLAEAVKDLAQNTIDSAIETDGDTAFIATAEASMTQADDLRDQGKPDKAIKSYGDAWVAADKAIKMLISGELTGLAGTDDATALTWFSQS